ncbi:MAG: hypothetical protein FWG77_02615 [Treponema sp.]|nr:hypothetical protein [Treponema sp.]
MSAYKFRTIDEWKSALMTLPESSFFELLRSVLGNIKTPFNKQRLLNDLVALLQKTDIKKVIKAYVDEQDQKIIAAIALLEEPNARDLEDFFAGEFTGAELNALLINLEERFILYRYKHEGIQRLSLNPVLIEVLNPLTKHTHSILPCNDIDPTELSAAPVYGDTYLDKRGLAGLFAYIQSIDEVFRAEGVIRRKVIEEGKKLFPGMDIEKTVKLLVHLELCRIEGDHLLLCSEKIADFAELSIIERQIYWIAAMYLGLKNKDKLSAFIIDEESGLLFRRHLRIIASSIYRFWSSINRAKSYPEITLKRLWKLIEVKYGQEFSGVKLFPDDLLPIMEKAGLFQRIGELFIPVPPKLPKEEGAEPVIIMDTAFSIILLPEISFSDALLLAGFCKVNICTETTVIFELTLGSTVRGFDLGLAADEMLKLLQRLSGNRIDPNIQWTIKEWESRYAEISLNQGIILNLSEERRYLAKAAPVSALVQKTLAPGVYLLSSGDRAEAVKALKKAGVDIIAQPPPPSANDRGGRASRVSMPRITLRKAFPALDSSPQITPQIALQGTQGDASQGAPQYSQSPESEVMRDSFRNDLGKMQLAKHERDELLARIERRLVLNKTQLEAKSLRYEKLEARGLDYSGKSLIAKQAIDAGSLVEVTWSTPEGEINRIIGIPQSLEKKDGDSIFTFRTGEDAGPAGAPASGTAGAEILGRVFEIPLRKISLLRRIKQSLFKE